MKNNSVRDLAFIAVTAALICVVGPLAIPIGPVPVSLTNLAIFIVVYAVGRKRAAAATALYLLIGIAGLPVFSHFSGGLQKFVGPTGGYLVGFLFTPAICGAVIDRHWDKPALCILGMIAAKCVSSAIGTTWLALSTGMTAQRAITVGVLPFILEDLVKIVLVSLIGPAIRRRLSGIIKV